MPSEDSRASGLILANALRTNCIPATLTAVLLALVGHAGPPSSAPEARPLRFTAASPPLPEMLDHGVPAVVARSGHEPGELLIKFRTDSPTLKSLQSAGRTPGLRGLAALGRSRLAVKLAGMGAQDLQPVFRVTEQELTRPAVSLKSASPEERALAEKRKGLFRWYRLGVPGDADVEALVAELGQDAEIEVAEPNQHRRLAAEIPPPIHGLPDAISDPGYALQWHLENFSFPPAWLYLQENGQNPGGTRDTVVAVIDTGVDYTHEDLVGNMWINPGEIAGNGIDDDDNGFVDDIHGCSVVSDPRSHSGDPVDYMGHGTHVAGIVAATAYNEKGGVGTAFNTSIMAVRAAHYSGTITSTDIAEGVLYAVDNGADIINMSFGGYAYSQIEWDTLAMALHRCVLVAAAGNDNLDSRYYPLYPAAWPFVIGVGALNPDWSKAWFSNYGDAYETAAPGVSIHSTLPGNQYAAYSGTSMAAPVISGMAALVRSWFREREVYSSRFVMSQIVAHFWDAYLVLTEIPPPGVSLYENWLFDDASVDPDNVANGIVNAGETIQLAIELINRSGSATAVTAVLEARAGVVMNDPYVTMVEDTVHFPDIGPFNIVDNGITYDAEGVITGVSMPFVFSVVEDCPNEHVIPFVLTITYRNGWDPEDTNLYQQVNRFEYVVTRGRDLPRIIGEDMDLTANDYWIVKGPVLIEAGATVTVHPGTQIQWGGISDDPYNPGPQNGSILVRGQLNIIGSVDSPVLLFPSQMLQAQTTYIASDQGQINLHYARLVNPELLGISIVDHCYFQWDAHAAQVSAQRISHSVFEKFRGGGSIQSANAFTTCLFDAGWLIPGPSSTRFINCVFLQDNEASHPLVLTTPWSFSAGLTREMSTPDLFYQPIEADGSTYVIMPIERGDVALAETIAGFYGGHMLSIGSQSEYEFVQQWIGQASRIAYEQDWYIVGLDDSDYPGDFRWTDGRPFEFSAWRTGEPAITTWSGYRQVGIFDNNRLQGSQWGWYVKTGHSWRWHGAPDWWNQFLLRLPGSYGITDLEAPFHNGEMLAHVRTHFPPYWRHNAFLSSCWDPNVQHWMTFKAPDDLGSYSTMRENYWGTTNKTLIDHMIIDYTDNFTSAQVDYSPPAEHGYPSTYPFAEQVLINGANAVSVPLVEGGRTDFRISFNRDMDTNIQPFVTFGPSSPYTDFLVTPRDEDYQPKDNGWIDARTWEGSLWMTPMTGNGYHLMRISGAVAADDPWLVTGYDVGRFRFQVQTMGVAAMRLQANGREGSIELLWQQDDYELLAGYNLYRAATIDGTYERLNTTIIPKGSERFVDADVTPAVPMFYKFTVVTTDFQESDYSNVAAAAAVDTIPPWLEHAAVTRADGGRSLRLTARATDNVRVVSVSVFHRPIDSGAEFNRLEMVNLTGNDWSATIPGTRVAAPGLEYYVQATDGISSVYSGTAATPHTVMVVNQPAVTAVSPNHGPAGGGTTVSVSGLLFQAGATVLFGEAPASEVVVLGEGQITCKTPPHYPATVDVKVVNPDDSEGILLGGFRFETDETVVALPQIAGDYGTEVQIPLTVSNATGLRAASATVTFDPAVLELLEVTLGPLTSGWSLSANTAQAGQAVLSLASSTTVTGSGAIALLRFRVNAVPPASTALTVEGVSLNDGAIAAERNHGRFDVNAFWSLAGTVNHFSGRPVTNARLRLLGTTVTDTTSDPEGTFTFRELPTGDYTLTPSKEDDLEGISSLDASYILRQEAGLVALSEAQRVGADVNGNGVISAMDASYVLEYVVGLRALPFPGVGRTWRFLPQSRSYAPLAADLATQDFTAVLIGDVTGNWGASPDPARAVALAGPGAPGNLLSLRRQDLPDGSTRWWVIARVTQDELYALDLVLTATEGDSLGDAQTSVADGAASFHVASHADAPGRLRIALASALPAQGLVSVLQIRLPAGHDAQLELGNFQANEGNLVLAADPTGLSLNQDSDEDGLSDWSEVLAGTDALAKESRLRMLGVDLLPEGRKRVRWALAPGRSYRVEFKYRLEDPVWQDLGPGTQVTGEGVLVDDASSGERYYRVRLEP